MINTINTINTINYGYENYDSTMAPFFRQYINNDISLNNEISILDNNNIDIINEFKLLGLPKNINDFFINHQAFNKEIYFNEYTFISIKKILDLYDTYKNDNINNIIDIGFLYHGMGFIKVIYYNTKFNKLFFRLDGGSNNYDILNSYNNMKNISTITNIDYMNSIAYDFQDLFNYNI